MTGKKGGKKENKKIVCLDRLLVFSNEMIRTLSSFVCAGKNVKSGEPTETKIGGHVPNWTKNSTLPCTMSRMQMEATGKHQCTMV